MKQNPTSESTPGPYAEIERAVSGISDSWFKYVVWSASFVSFLLIINSSWNATPDSALYLSLAESLAQGQGYIYNGERHTFVPPGMPLLLAAVGDIGGRNFLTYRVFMALAGFLTAIGAYLFVSRFCGRPIGTLIGSVFAVNHVLLENSALVLADVPFAMLTFFALYAASAASTNRHGTGWVLISGVLIGLLPIIRINGLGIPPVICLYYFFALKDMDLRKRLFLIAVFLITALAPTLVWQLWKSSFPISASEGSYYNTIMHRSGHDQMATITGAFIGYFAEINYAVTGLSIKTGFLEFVIPLIMLFGVFLALRKGDRLLAPIAVVQFSGLLLSTAGSRYLIFLEPALYLFLALAIVEISKMFPFAVNTRALLLITFAVLGVCNFGHNLKTVFQARTALEVNGAESERSRPFFTASRWLKANAPDGAVLTTGSRIIHYLSGCPTIAMVRSGVPDHEIWLDQKEGIRKIVMERGAQYVFADEKDAQLFNQAFDALKDLGMEVVEIPEASSPPRYRLMKIMPRRP